MLEKGVHGIPRVVDAGQLTPWTLSADRALADLRGDGKRTRVFLRRFAAAR